MRQRTFGGGSRLDIRHSRYIVYPQTRYIVKRRPTCRSGGSTSPSPSTWRASGAWRCGWWPAASTWSAAPRTPSPAPPRWRSAELDGPLTVSLENGTLTIVHERLTWGGLLDWVGNRKASATVSVSVPADCPVELGVVSADAVVSGIVADRTAVKSVSGDVTLDGVRSDITAQTVSGDLETRQLLGTLRFTTVSGDLTVVDGASDAVKAETVSGDLTLDLDPRAAGGSTCPASPATSPCGCPRRSACTVDIKTMSGSLDSAFSGIHTERKPGKATLHGQVGDGDGRLTAKTVSGDITLLRRSTKAPA